MKKILFLLSALAAMAFSACSEADYGVTEPTPKTLYNHDGVTVVRIVNGKIAPASRITAEFDSLAIAFENEMAYNQFIYDLGAMTDAEKMEVVTQYGVKTLHQLADEADNELDTICQEASSEAEFSAKYTEYVEKYKEHLIQNYIDETDLNLYVPKADNVETFIANLQGVYVVGDKVRELKNQRVLADDDIAFSQLAKAPISYGGNEGDEKKPHKNGYSIIPKKHKKVTFKVEKNRNGFIKVTMEVKKKMWYGWKNDTHRDLIFEPYFTGAPLYWMQHPKYTRYWTHGKKKIEAVMAEIVGSGKVGGTIYTWTDFSAEHDANNNIIIEPCGNTRAPRCLVSKSETVTVDL